MRLAFDIEWKEGAAASYSKYGTSVANEARDETDEAPGHSCA